MIYYLKMLLIFVLFSQNLLARKIQVLGIRHAESMNNILSQDKNPFRFLRNLISQRHKLFAAGEKVGHNPVLSSQGREEARLRSEQLFPNSLDPKGIFKTSPQSYQAVLVSPLHRTVQTTLLLFGTQMYKNSIPLIPYPSISEYKRSSSEAGSTFESSWNLFNFEQEKFFAAQRQNENIQEHLYQAWLEEFRQKTQTVFAEKWWPHGKDTVDGKETPESLGRRITQFKKSLSELSYERVIIVSHGTYLRTLFFGLEELETKEHPLVNLAFIKGTLETDTGAWSNLACLNPATNEEQDLELCLRR